MEFLFFKHIRVFLEQLIEIPAEVIPIFTVLENIFTVNVHILLHLYVGDLFIGDILHLVIHFHQLFHHVAILLNDLLLDCAHDAVPVVQDGLTEGVLALLQRYAEEATARQMVVEDAFVISCYLAQDLAVGSQGLLVK